MYAAEAIIPGFQHYIVMLGNSVIIYQVPIISINMANHYNNETDPHQVAPSLLGLHDDHCHVYV
jgi:hypothetical protein